MVYDSGFPDEQPIKREVIIKGVNPYRGKVFLSIQYTHSFRKSLKNHKSVCSKQVKILEKLSFISGLF
jgi:hypothetical protein